jgi:hypothetical protein
MRLVASFIAAILLASCAAHSNIGDYIRSMSAFFWQIANYGHLLHLQMREDAWWIPDVFHE